MHTIRSAAVLFLILTASLAAQKATHVVISEFGTRGAGSCNTACEFVELYNPTTADVDIAGWKLQYRSASGTSYSTLVSIGPGSVIRRNSYFLIAPSAWTSTPAADASWAGSGFADNGNIRIVNAGNAEIDRIGYGSGNDPRFDPMKASIRSGGAGFFQIEAAESWRWSGKETVDATEYETGMVAMVMESAFGTAKRELKALMSNGKVIRWLDAATGKPL